MYRTVCRCLASSLSVVGLVLATAPQGQAKPGGDPPLSPYPNTDLILASYDRLDPSDFFIPGNYGVYFLSPTGLNCGIWLKGSFGCSGSIPGLPPGTTRIGWFNGDPRVHYDWTVGIQFPNVEADRVLPARSYLNWNETTCVITADSSTYCKRGNFRFFVTPTQTWVN